MAHSVAEQIAEILDSYSKEVREAAEKDIEKVAQETAKRLKQTSPKASGDYAKDWAVKKDRASKTTIVHNRKHYRLTHLLEKGHVSRNQYGTWGRVRGEEHIAPAEQWATAEVVKRIEEDLER